jgi:hypothetical protein
MPINYKDYPADWKAISLQIRTERAAGRCECEGECERGHAGRCAARQGDPCSTNPTRGVVLTVAHLWRGPCTCNVKCGDPQHLKAMCQACHLIYDLPHHVADARRTRARLAGQLWLGDMESTK